MVTLDGVGDNSFLLDDSPTVRFPELVFVFANTFHL